MLATVVNPITRCEGKGPDARPAKISSIFQRGFSA